MLNPQQVDTTTWAEIQEFAKQLVELTDEEIDTWTNHAVISRGVSCPCRLCRKYALYTHVVESIERWEGRKTNAL
jgi:hypothetical protein